MQIKAIDLVNLLGVVTQYAQLTHFSDTDHEYDYQARRRAKALLKAVTAAAESWVEKRAEAIDLHCEPAKPGKTMRDFKTPEDGVVMRAFDSTVLNIPDLPKIAERDMYHPDFSAALMDLFERYGIVDGAPEK